MDNQDVAEFLLYNKMQDVLMFLGSNAVLKMNVLLYHINRRRYNGQPERQYFYRETQYLDQYGNLGRGIQRTYNAFISLENLKPGGDGIKQYIMIRTSEIELMRIMLIPKLESYILNMSSIYETREGKLYVNEGIVKTIQIELGEQTIWFKPSVRKRYDGTVEPAVDMFLNNISNVNTLGYTEIYSLLNIIRTFDIFAYAANMLAYIGRAPMGLNMYDYTSEQMLTPSSGFKYNEPEYIKKKRSNTEGFFNKEPGRKKKNDNVS